MAQNAFDFKLKPVKIRGFGLPIQKSSKRTLGIRDKQILYRRAKGKCESCCRVNLVVEKLILMKCIQVIKMLLQKVAVQH